VPWRRVIGPALVTALPWLGLAFFSSAYFSSLLIDGSRTSGTIGVVFTLLTWFILIGSVIVLGAGCGAVWQRRRERAARSSA
jgi:membrane protein